MISVRKRTVCLAGISIGCVLAASGCVSKKYVSKQIAPVNQRLSQYEKKTDDRIAWMNNKEQNDVSQLNERIATTDQNVAQVSAAVQAAQGTASRAMEESDAAKSAASANSTAITTLESGVANALNYQLVDKADVLFAFNKSTLTPTAMAALDEVATKFQSMPRGVVELAGFTDPIGSVNYNLELSRRRAWAVQRYLVAHKVPLRSIHVVGLGKEAPPDGLEAESASTENGGKSQRYHMDRRVNIRVYGAGDITSSGGSQ